MFCHVLILECDAHAYNIVDVQNKKEIHLLFNVLRKLLSHCNLNVKEIK